MPLCFSALWVTPIKLHSSCQKYFGGVAKGDGGSAPKPQKPPKGARP
ncbi:hypothetical protein CLV88_102330 [Shimia abyssi]|uniref:Uncharacterized protein n=1 Tax=Shimia abyssi TaxID=1662395 RepID=A0A2P8FHS0_9RHOB|nr:hypothetical protein CLV88_102330 [Shimia abyssi]